MKDYYNQYFRKFRDKAPKHMVEWGGYQKGEPTGMASSLESCISFYKYIINKDSTFLDAGAGASSWMFRKLLKNVTSTDPDKDYLEVVKNIVGGDNYICHLKNCAVYDYVYWDYGNSERIPLMELGLNKCRKAMYIDDCHDIEVFNHAKVLANKNKYEIVNVESLDSYGRWGMIIEKKI